MSPLTPGFVDPVLDAQAYFRATLDALSRPGRVQPAGAGLAPPAPIMPAAAAVLLTLADAATPLWHDAGAAAENWLRFHCGAPQAETTGGAVFLLATGEAPALALLQAGTEEEPERGATLILQVASLTEGTGWRLRGPGIETEHRIAVEGAPPGFAADWARNRALFPRGVDVILCAGGRIAALPRGIEILEA